MPAEDVLLLSVEDSVERVSKLVKEELARLAALATASGSDAAQPDALAQRQRRLVADLGTRLALAYREAVHALLRPQDAAEANGKPMGLSDGVGSGAAVNGDAAPVTSDVLSTLLHTEPASSGSNVSSSGSQTPPFANPADLVVVHPASPLAAGGSGASPAPVGSERLHSSRDIAGADAASSANTASGNSSGLIFTAPAAPDSNGPPRASHASSGWGSQYLPGVSSATLLAGVAGLAAQDSGANNQGSRSNPASGPLPQLPAHATAASTGGGSASGLLSRLVANASAAAANGSPTLLRSVHAALGAGDDAAAAGSNSGLLPRVGAPGNNSAGLAQQQADAEAELLRRLQEQQQARNASSMAAGSAPLPHVHSANGGGSALQQQHQQQQALLQQLLQQHQQEQQQAQQEQQQQAFTYQVDPATGNVVAVMAQDVYGNGGGGAQGQAQQGGGQALVLNDGTLVLDGSTPELLQQQYLTADPNFSNLFGADSGVASAGNTGPLPPVYLPSAQQQQQQRLAAAIAARGSELQQQQLDLQQQQQQLSAALLAAQQQQAQQQHSQQTLNSLAALHAATGGANSEPLPMLVSIPNAQGGMTLALAAPGHGHHAGDLQQLAGHHALLPGGLTLAQAGTAASLLQQQQRLAGALSTPPSPLPGTAAGATLVAMPGGGLGALHGLHPHLGALGAGLSLGGLAAVQPLPASTAEMPGRFKVLPLLVQQRILTLCRTNPVITIRDFDDKVVSKLSLLVDSWGVEQALAMLDHLEYRMRTKQGAMKNGPGYLDVAVCSHLDMLKAQGACPKSMKLDEYAQQVLAPPVFHELCEAVNNNRWLAWEHFDQGIIQLLKRLPTESAVEKLQEITYHSFKNVDNVKGCIMSILNSKLREDRRRP